MSSFNEYIFALHLLSTVSFTQSSALFSQSNHPQTNSSDFCFFFLFLRISDSKTPTFWCSSRRNPFGMEIWGPVWGPFLCWAVSCLIYSFWCFADESEWVSIPPWSSCSPDNLELRNIVRGYAQIVRVFGRGCKYCRRVKMKEWVRFWNSVVYIGWEGRRRRWRWVPKFEGLW